MLDPHLTAMIYRQRRSRRELSGDLSTEDAGSAG